MNTQHNTRRQSSLGFGTLEVLLILLVAVVLAGAGWYVWQRHTNTPANVSSSLNSGRPAPSPTPTSTPTPDPYAGWKVYSNSQVSFKYPSDWTAGTRQATVAVANSPTFSSSAVDTASNPGAPIDLFLQFSTDGATIDCADSTCQVSAVVSLSNSQLPGAVLAAVNQTSGNGTKFTEYVVASSTTKVGDTSVTAVKAGSGNVYVFGQPEYNTNGNGVTAMEAARVTDVTALQSDSHLKELVSLINSVHFN